MAAHLDLEEQEQLEQVKAFWKRWGNLITWTLTAILAGFAAWQYWNFHLRQQADEAAALYDQFDLAARAQDLDKAGAADAASSALKERSQGKWRARSLRTLSRSNPSRIAMITRPLMPPIPRVRTQA